MEGLFIRGITIEPKIMFSKELQQLIEASLVDGVLTDQERAVIRKRALLDGVDPDEVDVLLDAELQRIRQKQEEAVTKVKKCPQCGEIIPALTGVCPSCGYVINAQSQDNKELMDLISEMEKELEDLKSSGSSYYQDKHIAAIDTYRRKAKMLYGDNRKVQFLLAEIDAELNNFSKKKAHKKKLSYIKIACVIIVVLLMIVAWLYSRSLKDKKEMDAVKENKAMTEFFTKQAQEQCDSLCDLLNNLDIPDQTNYKEIERKLLNVRWNDLAITQQYKDARRITYNIKHSYLDRKRSIAKQIFAVYRDVYGKEAYQKAPDNIFIPNTIDN